VEKYKERAKGTDGSYSQTRRVARTDLGRDGRWKKPQRKATITMHEPDYRSTRTLFVPRIEEEGRRQRNMAIAANQSLD